MPDDFAGFPVKFFQRTDRTAEGVLKFMNIRLLNGDARLQRVQQQLFFCIHDDLAIRYGFFYGLCTTEIKIRFLSARQTSGKRYDGALPGMKDQQIDQTVSGCGIDF